MLSSSIPFISVEQYAAFLDGNLPENEMLQMQQAIDADPGMNRLNKVAQRVEADVEAFATDPEATLPDELLTDDFSIPNLDTHALCDVSADWPFASAAANAPEGEHSGLDYDWLLPEQYPEGPDHEPTSDIDTDGGTTDDPPTGDFDLGLFF